MAKIKAALADLVNDEYPTSKAAREHGERLWLKHYHVMKRFGEKDKGRAHATIHMVAMLKDAGEHKAAEKVEHFLNWMCEDTKPTKEQRSIAQGMGGE
ncbi:hypothetical protein D6416_23495 [Salmonella enterica subsp. enterica]|nr:hypothetical protein [Salmonella enterica subsp. enterica]